MTTRLMFARPWVYGLFYGVFAGLFYAFIMGAQKRLSHPDQYSWDEAAIEGLALGAFFGTVMGVGSGYIQRRRRHGPGRDELRALTPRNQKIAVRAVYRGSVPDDPAVRDVALRLATHTSSQATEQRPLAFAFSALMIAIGFVAAIAFSPWYWLAVAGFIGFFAYVLVLPRRLDRRVGLLATRDSETAR